MLKKATGEELNTDYYIEYLKEILKYRGVFYLLNIICGFSIFGVSACQALDDRGGGFIRLLRLFDAVDSLLLSGLLVFVLILYRRTCLAPEVFVCGAEFMGADLGIFCRMAAEGQDTHSLVLLSMK